MKRRDFGYLVTFGILTIGFLVLSSYFIQSNILTWIRPREIEPIYTENYIDFPEDYNDNPDLSRMGLDIALFSLKEGHNYLIYLYVGGNDQTYCDFIFNYTKDAIKTYHLTSGALESVLVNEHENDKFLLPYYNQEEQILEIRMERYFSGKDSVDVRIFEDVSFLLGYPFVSYIGFAIIGLLLWSKAYDHYQKVVWKSAEIQSRMTEKFRNQKKES